MRAFFDTNVLVYLITSDARKADLAEELVARPGGVVSVQVLSEFANVSRRKYKIDWLPIRESLVAFRLAFEVKPITVAIHDLGLDLAERHGLSVFDGTIVAAALDAGCETILSEDMQAGRRFGSLTIVNPFAAA